MGSKDIEEGTEARAERRGLFVFAVRFGVVGSLPRLGNGGGERDGGAVGDFGPMGQEIFDARLVGGVGIGQVGFELGHGFVGLVVAEIEIGEG